MANVAKKIICSMLLLRSVNKNQNFVKTMTSIIEGVSNAKKVVISIMDTVVQMEHITIKITTNVKHLVEQVWRVANKELKIVVLNVMRLILSTLRTLALI